MTKKIGLILMLAGLALYGCNRADQPPAAKSAPVSNLTLFALDIGHAQAADGVVEAATLFLPTDKLTVSLRTQGSGEKVPVKIKLVAMSNGASVYELSGAISGTGQNTTNFELAPQPRWVFGRYLVEATLNGKKAATQEIEIAETVPGRVAVKPQQTQ